MYTHTHTLTRVRHMVNLLFLVSKTSDQTLSDGVISGISGIGDELLFKFRYSVVNFRSEISLTRV